MSLSADNPAGPGRRRAPRPSAAAIKRVREELDRQGLTIADWARTNGESIENVNAVLVRGGAVTSGARHRIAVKLGLKKGVIVDQGEADMQPHAARADNHRPAGLDTLP